MPAKAREGSMAQDTVPPWGYGYSDLLADLEHWKASPFVKVDSVGTSLQGRGIFMVTITEGDSQPRPRIFLHARTHPAEVQALQVAKAGIEFLIDSSEEARRIRRNHIVHFIPMYNPDGVELGYARLNADSIDLESNWDKPEIQPEVAVLRSLFDSLMHTESPVRVALNLHSDQFNCTRFFFFHDSGGTSRLYTDLEKTFVADVQGHFPGGIEPWFFVKSWTNAPGLQYPEGWWWTNYREEVMALTYEDSNCPNASEYEATAQALLLGSADFIARGGVYLQRAVEKRRRTWVTQKMVLESEARWLRQNRPVFSLDGKSASRDLGPLIYFTLPHPPENP